VSDEVPTYRLRGGRTSDGPRSVRYDSRIWPDRLALLLIFGGVPLMLLVLTVQFRITEADLTICRWFYFEQQGCWHCSDWLVFDCLYRYGPIPGLLLGIGGLTVSIMSKWQSELRRWAGAGLFLALLLALGPGVIINGIFKPNWYRPRPKQVSDFGGKQDFVYVWDIARDPHSRSFPSGHASMGFYLMAPAFLLYRRHPRWALAFLGLGLLAGSTIGVARLAQGGHFASDVLWSGGMVYATGVLLCGVFQFAAQAERRRRWQRQSPPLARCTMAITDPVDERPHVDGHPRLQRAGFAAVPSSQRRAA